MYEGARSVVWRVRNVRTGQLFALKGYKREELVALEVEQARPARHARAR